MNTKIQNMAILNKDLSDGAFKIYCILAMLAWNDYEKDGCVSIHTLAEISGKSPEIVQALIKELIEKKFVSWSAKKLLDNLKWVKTPSLFNLLKMAHFVMDYDPRFGYFSFVDEVAGIVLFPEAFQLYRIFAMLAGASSIAHTNLKELSKLFGKNKKDTQKWIEALVNAGIIEIIAPDIYVIYDAFRNNKEERV